MSTALSALTIAALIILLGAERLRPAFNGDQSTRRIIRNVGLGVAGALATLLVVTPVSLAAAQWGLGWRSEWPLALRVLSDLLILELFIYGWHRANHEVPFLWRFHRVHHYDNFLDVTSALRFHPGEVILSALVRGTLIALLDLSISAILIFDAAVIIAAGFHHANLKLSEQTDRALRRVVVTPHHHRIHHLPERRYTDSNYGTVLTIWDRLFGTYREAVLAGHYGVAGEKDRPFSGLLVDPIRDGRD